MVNTGEHGPWYAEPPEKTHVTIMKPPYFLHGSPYSHDALRSRSQADLEVLTLCATSTAGSCGTGPYREPERVSLALL